MKIVLTGSAGFIGRRLALRLLEARHRVFGVDVKDWHEVHPNYSHFILDFASSLKAGMLDDIFRGEHPDLCIHNGAVADIYYARNYPVDTVTTNVLGTARIAEVCSRHHVPMLYISSCCAYGHTPEHPTTENAPTCPAEIYGNTKLAGELVVRGFNQLYGMTYNVVRPSSVYGAGLRSALAVYIFLEKAMKGERLPIHGSGRQTRTFIYVDDLVDGILELVTRTGQIEGEVFNMAGMETISVLELVERILRLTGRDGSSENYVTYLEDRPGQVMNEQISIEKAKRVLGWTPKVNMDEGLKRTLEWMKRCGGEDRASSSTV